MEKNIKTICIILLFTLSCNNGNEFVDLTNKEWKSFFQSTLILSDLKSSEILVYNKFDNHTLRLLILDVYKQCSDLGYIINDSIINYINNRKDITIPQKIIPFKSISIIYDTIDCQKEIITYSEPLFVSDSILLVALSLKRNSMIEGKKVFIIKKYKDYLRVVEYYDYKKKMFYEIKK